MKILKNYLTALLMGALLVACAESTKEETTTENLPVGAANGLTDLIEATTDENAVDVSTVLDETTMSKMCKCADYSYEAIKNETEFTEASMMAVQQKLDAEHPECNTLQNELSEKLQGLNPMKVQEHLMNNCESMAKLATFIQEKMMEMQAAGQ